MNLYQLDRARIRPLGPFLLVMELSKEGRMTPGGVALPDTAEENRQPLIGQVIAVGEGELPIAAARHDVRRRPLQVEPGDYVLYKKHIGHLLPNNHVILLECDLLAVIDPSEDA